MAEVLSTTNSSELDNYMSTILDNYMSTVLDNYMSTVLIELRYNSLLYVYTVFVYYP